MSDKPSDTLISDARKKLWRMGVLEWKLDSTQRKIYEFFKNNESKTTVITASRRLGKSYILTVIAAEYCLQKPKSIVKLIQPEQKMVRMNIKPLMEEVFKDAPPDLRPTFKTQDNIYVFSNGSEIQLAGTDNGNHDKLRGGNCHLALVDEAAFCTDLKYIINSILIPSTTLTKGKIVLSSTPPRTANHEFVRYMEMGELKGMGIKKTIWDAVEDSKSEDNPRITKEIVEDIVKNMPNGEMSDEFRTEYLCEVLRDGDLTVIPEFTPEVEKDMVVAWPRPAFYDVYEAMDIGFKDLTAVLFAYYDFENGVVVVEDEIIMQGPKMTTEFLAEEIVRKEQQLWTSPVTGEFNKPYLRVSDNNLIVINDLNRLHRLLFLPTKKDNKEAQINQLRMMVQSGQIKINPRCKTLIQHIKNATWNNKRTEFSRSADNGHFDSLDALLYLVRNIDRNKNPFPRGHFRYGHINRSDLFLTEKNDPDDKYSKIKDIFRIKSSLHRKDED